VTELLPAFTADGVLPPGDYVLTLDALRTSRLVTGEAGSSPTWDSAWRTQLVTSLAVLVHQLWQVGIDRIFVDSSFVEDKDHPNDIDGYFECDARYLLSGRLQRDLNALDPYKVWTWSPASRRTDPTHPSVSCRCGISIGLSSTRTYPGFRVGFKTVMGTTWSSRRHSACRAEAICQRESSGLRRTGRMMIRNEAEYQEAQRRVRQDREVADRQREALTEAGFAPEEVERGMEPLLSFQAQLAEEIEWYERVRRRDFPVIRRLTQVGQLLIALRIAGGLTQRELAERLGISESVVSRDERNEYHGITVERAQKVLDALHASISAQVDEGPPVEEPAPAGAR